MISPSRSAGVGFTTRQVGNRTRPNLIVSVDDQGTVCMKSQSTFKTTEIKFKLNEPFEETTADDRKTRVSVVREQTRKHKAQPAGLYVRELTACLCCVALQTVVTLENGKLVQKQCWDGKETNIEREVADGKLIAVRILFF